MSWKCLIVDDDPVQCELIASYCEHLPVIGSAEATQSGMDALVCVKREHYDLVFLDLNMPEVSGKDLLELLPPTLPVVMITADPGFAVESYNYNVVGYLVKPISLPNFLKAIDRIKLNVTAPEFLFVKEGTSQTKIQLNQLRYVKSESNYVMFYVGNKRIMSLMRLADLEAQLPHAFVRVHRSYIVNTQFIQHATGRQLMVEQTPIPISESYRKAVAERLQLSL